MKSIKLKNYSILVYDSIEELPITNFTMYNRYLLIDSGIGGTLEDVDTHIERLAKYIETDSKLAVQELLNMRQTLYFINQGVNPRHMAFAALVHSINNVKIEEVSEQVIKEVLDKVSELTNSQVELIIEDIKKKLESELSMFFSQFDSADYKEVYSKLKERVLVQLNDIINDTDSSDRIKSIDTYFLLLSEPKNYAGRNSVEIKHIKEFETACIIIAQETNMNAKLMNTLQFMLALEQIKKKHTPKSKRNGK